MNVTCVCPFFLQQFAATTASMAHAQLQTHAPVRLGIGATRARAVSLNPYIFWGGGGGGGGWGIGLPVFAQILDPCLNQLVHSSLSSSSVLLKLTQQYKILILG